MRRDNDLAYQFWLAIATASGIITVVLFLSCMILGE